MFNEANAWYNAEMVTEIQLGLVMKLSQRTTFLLHKLDKLRCPSVDVYAFATIYLNQGVTLTFDLQNLTRSSIGASGPVSFIETAQVVHEIWCSQDLTLTACCDLDLWPPKYNQVISMGYWIFPVSFIKIVLAFMRYRGNNIWPDERTNEWTENYDHKQLGMNAELKISKKSVNIMYIRHETSRNQVNMYRTILLRSQLFALTIFSIPSWVRLGSQKISQGKLEWD